MLNISTFEISIILAVLSLNFSAIICFKNKIMVISLVMIANLILILLYSTIISDYLVLQELIISTVFYSITTLILISNAGFIGNFSFKDKKTRLEKKKLSIKNQIDRAFIFMIIIFFSTIFVLSVFYFSNNFQSNKLNNPTNELSKNVISNQKKQDLGSISNKINNKDFAEDSSKNKEFLEEGSKKVIYQKSVEKNILFKRSTDAILIMIGALLIIFLYDKFWKEKKSI